jgi:hypothetical protein
MSNGFSITSGTGTFVSIDSSNDAVGVFLDTFFVPYNTNVTRSYPNFYGSKLFTIITQQDRTKANPPSTSINNTTKTVSVTSTTQAAAARQSGLYVTVLGK